MHATHETKQIYTQCERCGKDIPEQSAIEENGILLCNDCLMKEVKRDLSRAESEVEELRRNQHSEQLTQTRKKQRQRALLILLLCTAALGLGVLISYQNRLEPVPQKTVTSKENPEIVKSILDLAIYKYQKRNAGTLPENLQALIPGYIGSDLSNVVEQFTYVRTDSNRYILKLKESSQNANTHNAGKTEHGEEL